MTKCHGGWDSNIESENSHSLISMETSKIKSAIEILDNANFLDPENLKMLQKFA